MRDKTIIFSVAAFSMMTFFAGWLFCLYIAAQFDPTGTLNEYRQISLDCSQTAWQQNMALEKLASIKLEALAAEDSNNKTKGKKR